MSHTPGTWKRGNTSDSIISDCGDGISHLHDEDTLNYYGGYVIAESVLLCNQPIIMAAPDLLAACEEALKGYNNLLELNLLPSNEYDEEAQRFIDRLRIVIAKAKGQDA